MAPISKTFEQDLRQWRASVLAPLSKAGQAACCTICAAADEGNTYMLEGVHYCAVHALERLPGLRDSANALARRHCKLAGSVNDFDLRAAYEAGFTNLSRWHLSALRERSNHDALQRHLDPSDPLDRYLVRAIRDRIDALIHSLALD